MNKYYVLPLIFSFILTACSNRETETTIIPVEDFFRNPKETSFELSPNGEFVSFLKPYKNRMNLYVLKMDGKDTVQLTNYDDRNVEMHMWAGSSKLVFSKDNAGDENYQLYSVKKDGSELTQLTFMDNSSSFVIDPLINNDDEIIIKTNDRDKRIFDVYRLNINTGERKLISENPGNVSGWLTDHEGKLRVAVTTDGVNQGILYRESEDVPFRITSATNFKEILYPVAFTYDNKYLYMISNLGRDKNALVKYDVINNEEMEVIFEHYDVDVEYVFVSDVLQKIVGVSFVTDKTEFEFFDDDRYLLQKNLEQKLPGKEVWVVSADKNETKMLVRTSSDRTLGAFYYYDKTQDLLTKLADIGPWLNEEDLSPMKPVTYKARDGLTIHGYLTIPQNRELKNLPVVIYPHGGPWTRNKWGYNSEVQFFANRGYAVLQMNYRGSKGYGRKFWEAGFGEWGLKMQDDITDGVSWLVQQGIADPARIAIYGYSFGGYCTLQGLVKTPDLYACGVSYSGFNNVFHLMEAVPPMWEPFREMLYEMVGNPVKDKEKLNLVSPYYHVDKISTPVFIAQGKNDKRVDVTSVEIMAKKLKNMGITVDYMLKENEGHGFKNEENRIEFFKRVEQFLNKYLSDNKTIQ